MRNVSRISKLKTCHFLLSRNIEDMAFFFLITAVQFFLFKTQILYIKVVSVIGIILLVDSLTDVL